MTILHDILVPLQASFSNTNLGKNRAQIFVYSLMSITLPFTSSITSNLFRSLVTLFGFDMNRALYYRFMASSTLPWNKLWSTVWNLIPSPITDGYLILALDDCINTKVGKKIFACETIFDHAAKANQTKYVWAQNFVCVGLLKMVKGRWACLPLAFLFYIPLKTIVAEKLNALKSKKVVEFKTKMEQSAQMILTIANHFSNHPVLVVADSWFGNKGLYKLINRKTDNSIFLLSRLRSNNNLFDLPKPKLKKTRGAKRKYGEKLGNATTLASKFKSFAKFVMIKNLYGKPREVLAYEQVFMLKTLKCPVRVVWVYRKTQWVAFFTTDLNLSVVKIISYYSGRWKIESNFKELKGDIGSQKSQTRNAHAVTNHLQFCMMSATLTWIYADRLKADPQRRHKVKGRTSFAFSDIRKIMAEEVLDVNFDRLCHKPAKTVIKSFIPTLLRMVA
jgi:hypothetical protein